MDYASWIILLILGAGIGICVLLFFLYQRFKKQKRVAFKTTALASGAVLNFFGETLAIQEYAIPPKNVLRGMLGEKIIALPAQKYSMEASFNFAMPQLLGKANYNTGVLPITLTLEGNKEYTMGIYNQLRPQDTIVLSLPLHTKESIGEEKYLLCKEIL